ncbi:unnamed protein product [Effrenium voratum]|uniref:Uncharacterized protein n=1 Tax=Effrenium voratum TaxID=2562239 RepID=A0AA36MQU2_9DINO|nr:unnamed protein product [Effrenium voratum]
MVCFHDVWSKGTQMCSVGFQKKLLDGQTICTQLATAETKRLAQVQANRQLVSEAKGHLAPVSGQEGFLSLAGSHSVAFLRWCWVVLAASIEEAIPQLPNFIQMAANSSNSISKAINELEVALHVATAFEKGLSLPDAIQQASQGDVRCRASVPAIAKFVQNFGGGSQGFPLLHFLANFSKQFNATLLVGTELMSTLATLSGENHWLSLQAILTAYTKEIHDPSGADASSADQAKTQTDMQVTDVLAASHKTIAMLQNHHMELGKLYTNKDHGAKVFELTDMTDDHATMTHKPLFHDQEEVHVPLRKLPTWKATKALMPMLCPEELAREGMTAKILLEERARSEVQLALHKAAERHHLDAQTIAFGQNPQGLLATKAIRKTIRLVPLGMVNKAKPTTKETKLLIEHGGHTWTIGPFRQNLQFEADSPACLIPFFWCKPTSEPSEVTMVYSTVVESGITIPCLENPAPLEPRQQLLFLAAHAEASEADHGEASGAAEPSEATPKAKAKNKAKAKEQSEPPSKKPKK